MSFTQTHSISTNTSIKQVALNQNANLDSIPTDRYRANTKVEDGDSLLNEGMRFRYLEYGIYLTPDPKEYVDGLNQYIYVNQNPWSKFDPHGLETYRLNRQLSLLSIGSPDPVNHGLSHTFNYTTRPDGSLKDTYSWGNSYDDQNRGEWHRNSPEDVRAARIAIEAQNVKKTLYSLRNGLTHRLAKKLAVMIWMITWKLNFKNDKIILITIHGMSGNFEITVKTKQLTSKMMQKSV